MRGFKLTCGSVLALDREMDILHAFALEQCVHPRQDWLDEIGDTKCPEKR